MAPEIKRELAAKAEEITAVQEWWGNGLDISKMVGKVLSNHLSVEHDSMMINDGYLTFWKISMFAFFFECKADRDRVLPGPSFPGD